MSKLHSAKAAIASSKGTRRLKRSTLLLSAGLAAIMLANPARAQLASTALPTGGDVVAGSATIGTPTPTSMTINQGTDRAVINWNSFDIGSGASVTFVQPSATSIAVNRVVSGAAPSEIAGQLNANGRIAILNPNGVLFSGTANVNVGSLIASTGDIDQAAFTAGGNMEITGATTGAIVVNGNINISAGSLGLAAFVAPTVRNSGVITARAGRVQLGGGTAFTLDLAGDGLLSIGVPASSALVENNGQIFAEGGRIQMSAKSAGAAVDNLINTGTLSVDSFTIDNGTIVLEAVGGSANLRGTVAANDRASISRNILISSDQGVNISGNLSGASGTVNITAPHIYGTGKISTATALKLNLSNNGSDTRGQGNFINDALGVIGTTSFGTTISLGAGTYSSGVRIDASDVTIDGQGVAKIGWTSGIENAIDVSGDYVTIKNLEISGPATSAYTDFAWGSTYSRGIFVNRYADMVQLLNNNIHDIRTGIIVDGRNTNVYLQNNRIDNTKSAISVQYTDGSNVTMAGNTQGQYGNEWGINLYLNGILQGDGVTILASAGSLGANTPLAEQQRLLALRAANGGMEVQNQGWSASNRTAAYVSTTGSDSNQGSPLGTLASVQAGVNAVVTGGTVHIADGTYTLSNTLFIQKSLTLLGTSEAGTIFNASGLGVYGMRVHADKVTLGDFTLLAPSAVSTSTYGLKVEVGAGDVNGNARIDDFAIRNVTISGSRKTGLDLNSVIGATIDNVNVTGALAGNGIAITDSANVLVKNSSTSGNAWGGLALYQANGATGSNQQLTGITIEGNNTFSESNGLYLQDSSAINDPGTLSIAGYDHIVRNTAFRADGSQFTFFRTSLSDATGYALSLGTPTSSSIEGWNGSTGTNSFTVVAGLGIGAAVREARAGASISVGAGTYAENVVINKTGISLLGAGRDVTTINGISNVGALGTVTLAAGSSNTTLSGFTINGIENGNPGSETGAVYLQQTNTGSRIINNRILAAGDLGLVSEWGYAITGLVVDGNIISGKTYVGAAPATGDQFTVPNVSRQLVALGGGGVGGGISFTNNVVNGDSGLNTGVTIDSAGSTITGNSFATTTGGFGAMLRVRGAGATITGNAFDMAGVAYTANGLYVSDAAMGTAGFADLLAANTLIGAGAWANNSATGYHSFSRNIQAAVNEAAPGAVVTIRPGDYLEGVTGVGYYGDAGAQSFGLYLYKDNITLRGVDAAGNAITDADDVAAFVTSRYQAGFGAQHFISGNGVTIEGLGFKPAAAGDNKTVEVSGNAFTLRNSVIDNRGNQTAANLYIDDFNDLARTRLESFTITGNKFYGGTYASAMVVVAGGAGRTTDASNRIFANNSLSSSLTGMRGFQIQGYMPNTPWQQLYAGAVTVTGNSFEVDIPVRTVGLLSSTFAWDDVFRNNGNRFLRGGVLAYEGSSANARATITAGGDPDIRITSTIDASIARAQNGDTVRILDGTYVLGSQLKIDRSIALVGQSQAGTILDGRTVDDGGGLGTIGVYADNTTLGNFTLLGSQLSGGNYGIKVQPNPISYAPSQRISNVTISDVTVKGSRRAELDINGAVGVTVTNFTADGQNTEGAGVQITDSANVTLTGVHTLGNNWGGVALYQTNRAGGYDGQTTNINIAASANNFEEFNGLFAQLESTSQGFGQLNLTGYGYAVRNTDHRANGGQFTYFRTTLQDATTFGLSLGFGYSTSLENYTGTGFSNIFTVVPGLTISAAARDVRTGGTINVAAGTYGANTTIATNGVSLIGAAGAKIDARSNGSNGIVIDADGVTVSGFEIFGPADQSYVTYAWPTVTRGIVIANGADNVTVTGNNIHGVRNGILIDGRNANASLTSNLIDNTKSAISVQYTDGSSLNIAGNSEGTFGNEWGVIAYLNGIWNGTAVGASNGALGPNTPLAEQARLLALSAANGGMAVYNQGYSAANRTRAYIDVTGVAGAQGSQRTLLNLQGGLDAVVAGGTVHIASGTYNESISLNALRVLDFAGPITVNSLSFGAGAAGTNIATNLTATGALSFAVAPVLTGNTVLTGDTISLGAIASSYGLTLNGTTSVSIGQANLASLVVTGNNILTAGVITTGQQRYTGNVTLNGEYRSQGGFTVTGLATLAGDSLVGSPTVAIGGVAGAHDFIVLGTAITLGQVTDLASLSVQATTISTAGASTTGNQSYVGATTLNGVYSSSGGYFAVDGATTLGGNVSVTTNGTFANFLSTVSGAHDLVVDAGSGNVGFGAVSGLTSLSATGAAISTLGVATHGNQRYVGATTLAGTYTTDGGSLTVQGASSLATATSIITSGGAVALGAVNTASSGISDLTIDAGTGQVTLGTTFARTLSVTGASITTADVRTNGAQTYSGATTLNGTYNASDFTVSGATTLGGNTSIISTNAVLGSVGGTGALNLTASSTVTLGAVSGIGSLLVSGPTINTVGVTTTGGQSYNGTVRLDGIYSGSSFTAGAAQVTADSTVNTNGGLASFESATGAGNLIVNAGTGEVRFRTISGLASVFVTGNTIALLGNATTTGAQTYNGATTLGGQYQTGGAFTINGAATTTDSTTVTTGGGDAQFGAIAGAGTLTINAGAGNVTLGALSNFAISATGATILTNGGNTGGAQTYNGATTLVGSYSTGNTIQGTAFTVNGTTTLGGNTSITTRGNGVFGAINATGSDLTVNALGNGSLTLGAITGVGALSVTGSSSVTLGALTGLGSASVTGGSIVTAGATTSGAQSYTGTTSLNGAYSAGGNFTVTGSSILAGTTSIATGGNARFAAVVGTGSLGVTANGSVTLGSVNGIASLSATGATIALVNVRTTGAQSYTGAISLNGVYNAGGDFTVNGAATFGGNTGITAGGNASFGTIGGTGGVGVTATNGNVTLGTVTGLNSLSVRGASIITAGASTSGAQMYMGAISLNGAYATNGGVFTVVGATTLAGNTSVATTSGNVTLGTVSATGTGNGLTVNAGTGNVTLGVVGGIASLSVTGATITTAGATTAGAQSYTGATSLSGNYAAAGGFTVNGSTTLTGDTAITTQGGNAVLGTIAGPNALAVDAGTGTVTLGAASGLASLTAIGATITTAGASTSGAQNYTGATVLNGGYTAGSFAVNGIATLAGATSVATGGGNVSLGAVTGNANFDVNSGTGTVSLGAVSVASLSVTGANIATLGVSTSGVQSYTGATSLSGAYTTGGGAFTVSGATSLAGNTSVTSGNGAISLGAVDAAVAGGQSLALNAGTGSVALGNAGAVRRLGATSVNAGTTVLNGATYAANSLGFTGSAGATVRLTQGSTVFNTSLPGGAGGAISIAPALIGTTNAQQNVTFTAGNGLTANSGDVTLGNAGTDAIRLGALSVTGHNFSAGTVKLAGNYTSVLSGSQLFTADTLDTLGNVNAQVAGNESGSIRADGSVTIVAGGSGSGSLIAGGPVNLGYGGDVSRAINAQGNITVNSGGAITGPIVSTGSVSLTTTSGAVTSAVTGGSTVSILSQIGAIGATVTAAGGITVQTNGNLTGSYTSPSTITLTSIRPISVVVNGNVVTITAPSGTVTGVFSEIHTNNTGTLIVNDQPIIGSGTTEARQIIIDRFVVPAGGTVAANGEIQLPVGLALGLIAPAGNGQDGQRPAVVVNNVARLGELLRIGYTAIIIQLDDSNANLEEELAGQ